MVAGAFLAYGVATALGGSGFIAAFVAGLAFGHLVRGDKEPLTAFDEELGQLLDGVTFVVFGAVLLGPALEDLTWPIAAYALLSLTVVRMVPVALATLRSGAGPPTVAFLGWFGPRGLASIVFAVIVVEESRLPHVGTIVVDDLRHDRALGAPARPDRRAPRRPLRAVVRGARARAAAGDGERAGDGRAAARAGVSPGRGRQSLPSGRPDLNRGPHRPERCALPGCATPRCDPV